MHTWYNICLYLRYDSLLLKVPMITVILFKNVNLLIVLFQNLHVRDAYFATYSCIKNLQNFCCFKRKVFVSFNFKVCENVTFDNDYVYHFM